MNPSVPTNERASLSSYYWQLALVRRCDGAAEAVGQQLKRGPVKEGKCQKVFWPVSWPISVLQLLESVAVDEAAQLQQATAVTG
jgi:hypothetical protein